MPTYTQLVHAFGPDGVLTLDRTQVEPHNLRPDDVDTLCETGLPITAAPHFTMHVNGPYEALTAFDAQTPDRPARFLILGQPCTNDNLRYAMELHSGNIFTIALENGTPTPNIKTINTTLDSFIEFLYRIHQRNTDMPGTSANDARPYTEKLIAELKTHDERALGPNTHWTDILNTLLDTDIPKNRDGSRQAIAAALHLLHPDEQPLRWSTETRIGQGVQELSAHRADNHWLLVTHGFSDLDDILELDTPTSGLGFELTMRVPRRQDDDLPPGWALQTLRNLGEYVFGDGYPFADGHRMGVAGQLGPETSRLNALAFITDPQLGTINTPNGTVEFITAVGVTREELAEAKATSNNAVLARLTGDNGLPITDVTR
ncbi:suppressor of fused domain protein [Nonomuraea sp. NPDC046802]|uniref:suppressor of fused domain protein n=1 Tax=Nonomuraea sp. NPDC046802 TaxID=3154919 RepID=UPI0034004AE7